MHSHNFKLPILENMACCPAVFFDFHVGAMSQCMVVSESQASWWLFNNLRDTSIAASVKQCLNNPCSVPEIVIR